MLPGRVYRIFQRYRDIHIAFDLPDGVLRDESGVELGRLKLSVRGNRLLLHGDVAAKRLEVRLGVVSETAARGPDGYHLDMPLDIGPLQVIATTDQGPVMRTLPGVSAARRRRARFGLGLRFLQDLLRLAPAIHAWKWRGDMGARETVKEVLGLVPRTDAQPLPANLFAGPACAPDQRMATLLMPVYNAFDFARESLDRIARHSGERWRLIVVEDGSTDPGLRPWLEAWCADPSRASRITLLVNAENLGFIGSVNRGLAHAATHWPDDPVVLVNSDAMVPPGWLARMLAPLADPKIASVTPMSNDAEIFTVPVICKRHGLPQGAGDALDAVASTLAPETARADAPTGMGYCMAMAPQFLARVPMFDTAFGRGYGEENDWCQKAAALGGRNLGIGNLVVEHRGGASFGMAAKQRLLEHNLAEIARRYPGYHDAVQDFIRTDPLTGPRLALGLTWAGLHQETPVPVFLAHSLGGGAEYDLARRIAAETRADRAAVVLRVGRRVRWQVELHTSLGVTRGTTDETDLMVSLVELLAARRIVYSCGVGDPDPAALPDLLLKLSGADHEIEMLIHDYFPISPSYTLLDEDGCYRGVPLAGQRNDPAHHAHRPGGGLADLKDWQREWGRVMAAADRITVFSHASREIILEAYPAAQAALTVAPHPPLQLPPRLAPQPGPVPVIGVLGNIGAHKGAAVLARFSRNLARTGAARLVVLGQLDPDYRLAPPSVVHGGYEWRDLPGLVARYRITTWLIPSIWPETFSFTTHEALATGLPVFAFDLGAQGEAVAAAANGHVLPLPEGDRMDPEPILAAHRAAEPAS